jgi:1,2-dihydroxy-3-keto-5-methylthiopentene dioxygenase
MAILRLADGTIVTEWGAIVTQLIPLNIRLQHCDPGTSLHLPDLLSSEILQETAKQRILDHYTRHVECLKPAGGYLWADLLTLHSGSSNLHISAATESRYHTHTAPEMFYILAGEAIFGLVQPDGTQIQLLVQPQDFIHIPAQTEHWFSLAASLHLKAVRYFTTADGWIAFYTGRAISDSLGQRR